MQVACVAENRLTPQMAADIQELQFIAFPHETIFETQRSCNAPLDDKDLWFMVYTQGQLIGSVRVIHRTVTCESLSLLIAGIGNVCSHPEARGLGAAKSCMQAVNQYIVSGKVDFGILMAGPPAMTFYAKLGWQRVSNKFMCIDKTGKQVQRASDGDSYIMILGGAKPLGRWPVGTIDLNGQDW